MNELARAFVPADALDVVTERVDRISRRALRKGFPAPTLRFGETEDRPVLDEDGRPIEGQYAQWTEAIIEGEPIKLAGWELIAVVSYVEDTDGNAKPVVDRVPGVEGEIPHVAEYDYCGYCKTSRRRNETFIVRSVTEYQQVGRNCLRDFLGYSPESLIAMYEAYRSLEFNPDEVSGWGSSATAFYQPETVLSVASRIVAREGYYISKARAAEDDRASTSELVRGFLSARGKAKENFTRDYPKTDESDRILDLTLAAIPGLDPNNEYESKIIDLATARGVQWRHVGTLASAVIQGLRAMDRKAKGKGVSHFIGKVGERVTLPVKVTLKREVASDFGNGLAYFIIRMANGDNDILWRASWSATTNALAEGDEFEVTGTVKDHEFDRLTNRPTTVLTRCKVGEKTEGDSR